MSRRRRESPEDEWRAWAADQEARYPVTGEALVEIGGRVYTAALRHRYRSGGALVTLETGETRAVPGDWIEEV